MENNSQTVFLIDEYNKYRDKDKVRGIYLLNGRYWAILETELVWGKPQLDRFDSDEIEFHLYSTLEEAQDFMHALKKLEGSRL